MFSPYYAAARRMAGTRDGADPNNFCALNVALYHRKAKQWTMTERSRRHCWRDATHFVVGPSALTWKDHCLEILIREWTAPLPSPVRGTIRICPEQLFQFSTSLDTAGAHRWGPIAPRARIEVALAAPQQQWSGTAYLDSNEGDEPIERAFHHWDWSRSQLSDGSTAVLYDLHYPDDTERLLALRFGADGDVRPFETPKRQPLPRTAWGMSRSTCSDTPVQIENQLEDTPFYQRAVLQSALLGEQVTSFHETLSVTRLVSPVVRAMVPWRMPRRF